MKDCKCKVPVPDQSSALNCVNCGGRLPKYQGKAPGPLAGRVKTTPRCIGCGTSVEEGTNLCEVCKDKPQYQAPKATVQTGAQPTPAYQRPDYEGNFKPGVADAKPE